METDKSEFERVLGKVMADLAAGYGGVMVSIGDKLGLYRAMAGAGPLGAGELARRTGCAERYVLEWLNAQVAGGYVRHHADSGTYELTPEQASVLADENSPAFMPPAWQVVASMWFDEAKTLEAFRTGRGVGWAEHDPRLYCGVAGFYRNAYRGSLVAEWLPSLEGVVDRLTAGASVADVGCGHGHSTVLMAQAFPASRFWGFDVHDDSLAEARRAARAAGVEDRVRFERADARSYPARGYDLVCFFDCLHDMGHPVAAAAHAKACLAPDGTVMAVEPYAPDRLEDREDAVARIYYAASTTLCCAHAISENGTHVLGAQAGPRRLEEVFRKAGYAHFRQTVQTPFNLILEARPEEGTVVRGAA